MWWKILEQAQVVGTCGLEFRCGVTWSVTHNQEVSSLRLGC